MKQDEYPRLTEHAPHCPAPEYEWQQNVWGDLPIRGRCIHCGAVKIRRQDAPPVAWTRGIHQHTEGETQ